MVPDAPEQLHQLFVLAMFFVPNQQVVQKRMILKKAFISLSYQEINIGFGVKIIQLFQQSGGQDGIADKSRLYHQDFIHKQFTRLQPGNFLRSPWEF